MCIKHRRHLENAAAPLNGNSAQDGIAKLPDNLMTITGNERDRKW